MRQAPAAGDLWSMNATRPTALVGVPACRKHLEPHWFHGVGEKYLDAVLDASACVPVVMPAIGERFDVASLLAHLDGVLFTGSISNVEPKHYGADASAPDTLHDPHRDETTLPLLRAAIDGGVPVLAICRGFQEMNVALGGSLHQAVHDVDGLDDHREDSSQPLDVQYGPSHPVTLAPNGLLARLTGERRIVVNSLHGQGVERLAPGLRTEAVADDGLVEAFTVVRATAFALAVQWHPEWQPQTNAVSSAIFAAFGDACRQRCAARGRVA